MPTLTAPIADSPAGNKLSSIGSVFSSAMKENLAPKPVEETPKAEPEVKPTEEAKPSVEPKPETPVKDDKAKVEDKPAVKTEETKPDDKKGQKLSELPPDQKDFVLLASQKRQLDAFNAKNARIKELEDELNPTKTELAELRKLKETAPKDLERLNAEVARLQAENAEYDGKVKAYDVTNSREYKQGVKEPWDKNIVGEIKDGKAQGGLNLLAEELRAAGHDSFDANAAYNAVNSGDKSAFDLVYKSLPEGWAREEFTTIYRDGQKLLGKHRELTTDAGEKLKVIQERQTQAEREASERVKGEVGRIGAQLSEQVANRFPFLRGVEGDDNLNGALAKAKEAMEKFDVVSATPQERAEAAHARAFAPIIAARQELIIQDQQKQLAAKDEEHSKVEQELRQQIAGLEERNAALNGETVAAQPGNRDGNGRFAQKPTIAGVWKAGMKGVS